MTSNPHLALSPNGVEFIAAFEGYVGHVYNDAASNATIGFGHLLHLGPLTGADVAAWRGGISRRAALALLRKDAAAAERAVHSNVDARLTQWQFDALCSFVYNCGAGALRHGGQVALAVNSRPLIDVSLSGNAAWFRRVEDALLLWDHAGGRELLGLERRRLAEARVFETGKYSRKGGNRYSNWEG